MTYSLRIFISIVLVIGCGFWGYGYWLMKEIRGQYAETVEDSLVDFSNVLASYLSAQSEESKIQLDDFSEAFKNFKRLSFSANIHGIIKGDTPIDAYVTNADGKVLYHSLSPQEVGSDYSQWNDVYLTLKGQYGARSTRQNSSDPLSSVFYVAAPIQKEGSVIGVVSVIKPEKSLRQFIAKGRQKIILATLLVLLIAVILAALFSYWLTRPIDRLIRYAKKISQGEQGRAPRTSSPEFTKLTQAFDEMRISLEGKNSIENFVQHLVHELKSPLSAIQGSAELLEGSLKPEEQQKFLKNIQTESIRARKQLEDLLRVAALESRTELGLTEEFSIKKLLTNVCDSFLSQAQVKEISFEVQAQGLQLIAEKDLIEKSISALIANALDFAPNGSTIRIDTTQLQGVTTITVRDQGPGIPNFSRDRIFEKFYSLERPNGGKKSTGLGLNFVNEVMLLHGGTTQIVAPAEHYSGFNISLVFTE